MGENVNIVLTIQCDSCNEEIPFDKIEYERHIHQNHRTKINNKHMCFKAHIWRSVENE